MALASVYVGITGGLVQYSVTPILMPRVTVNAAITGVTDPPRLAIHMNMKKRMTALLSIYTARTCKKNSNSELGTATT